MILFVNVLVTDQRFSQGFTNRYDRLDIFKCQLASFARIDRIDEVIIYCELAESHRSRLRELKDFVNGLFPYRVPIFFHCHSPSSQRDWQQALEESQLLDTEKPVLYMGNDDHVFIDRDTDVLYEGLDLWAKEPADQINTIHISSWTEAISTIWGFNDYTRVGRYWVTDMLYPDACQIVNATFFKHVFFDLQMGDTYMRRTDPFLTNWYPHLGDYAFSSKTDHPKVKMFTPLREQVRHFDAYPHVAVSFEDCPQLTMSNILDIKPDNVQYIVRYEAHRRAMTAPHTRGFQDPRPRGKPSDRYRHVPDNERLPLDEETIQIGFA